MKPSFSAVALMALTVIIAMMVSCNNEPKEAGIGKKTIVDSLQELVDDAHNLGMAKMGQLTRMQQKTSHLVDSINKLPVKTQKNLVAYKAKLEGLLKELDYADFAMNKWMNEFYSKDTSINALAERVEFLKLENEKVIKVKEAILSGISKADSLINSK